MRLVVTTFLTLDGVMQAPGGPDEDRDGGFEHGGWVVPHFDDALGERMDAWFATADAFLLGRRTYEIFAAYWPDVGAEEGGEVARKLNALPKYVASATIGKADWAGTTIVRDVVGEVRRLKAQDGRELQVHGSGNLAQTLIAHDLVDEYRLVVFPVVLGTGKRLFGEGAVPAGLRLAGTSTTKAGVTTLTYEYAGRPEYGSFGV
jgi:dihydrofolate reductase